MRTVRRRSKRCRSERVLLTVPPRRPKRIPARLRRIIPILGEMKSNDEIAVELGLSKHTVENYVSELMQLTGVHDRTHLVVLIRETPADECE